MQAETNPSVHDKPAAIQPLTRDLGAFVAAQPADAIPPAAIAMAKRGIIDCIGVMIAGEQEPPVRILRDTLLAGAGGAADASLLFTEQRVPALLAAWVNGTAAHAHDFDDVGVGMRGHPSAVLAPAVLAAAQALGRSGREALAAYVTGYEVWADLARRDRDYLHLKGWHPTAVFGTVAAAAAAARLHRLDPARAAHAIGISASQAAGLMSNFGSMTKPLHAGQAAHAGLLAARLAAAGFTASADAIEHPRGFLAALSPAGAVDRASPVQAGTRWRIVDGLNIKRYPVCYFAHRAIDAMLLLADDLALAPDAIAAVTVRISRTHAELLHNHQPTTPLEAKFSAEFAMAAAIIARDVGLAELREDFVQRADVQALLRRVAVAPTDEEDPAQPGYAPFDRVEVQLVDGRTLLSPPVRRPQGHAERPLTDAQLGAKFLANLAFSGRTADGARHLLGALEALETLHDLNALPLPPAGAVTD
ncbi:MmgE/PrpD family protein [Xanthobacter dioxanivorans]|uniref:MmgE/PrpD family protein n=1 Tax=Xanthobacter dioxanivorans TaxID=2528964 RepID=A0A974PLP8_9HYPH|nr:MmgE/PrpD family protein [Xanthobacter dioxanivorans]QRG05864.1 MmgE/PrpD family protein [Xanthobacter dioxanivorans]